MLLKTDEEPRNKQLVTAYQEMMDASDALYQAREAEVDAHIAFDKAVMRAQEKLAALPRGPAFDFAVAKETTKQLAGWQAKEKASRRALQTLRNKSMVVDCLLAQNRRTECR